MTEEEEDVGRSVEEEEGVHLGGWSQLTDTHSTSGGISGLRESDGWRHRDTKEQPQPSELDPLQLRHSDQEEEEDDSSQNGATSITSGHGDSNDGVRGGKERRRGVEERHRESLPLLLWVSLLKESVEPRGMA